MDYRQKNILQKALDVRTKYLQGESISKISLQLNIGNRWIWETLRGENDAVKNAFNELSNGLNKKATSALSAKYVKNIFRKYRNVILCPSYYQLIKKIEEKDLSNYPPKIRKALEYRLEGCSRRVSAEKVGTTKELLRYYEDKLIS